MDHDRPAFVAEATSAEEAKAVGLHPAGLRSEGAGRRSRHGNKGRGHAKVAVS
jgi:hypothetical protein